MRSNAKRVGADRDKDDWPRLESEVQALLKDTSTQVVGARLKRYRLRQGFSIRDLAAKAEVSTNSVMRIESGGGVHSLTLVKICRAFGLHVVRLGDVDNLEPDGISALHHHADDRWYDLTDFGAGPLEDRPLSVDERAQLVKDGKAEVPLMIMRSRLETGRIMPTIVELYQESERRSHAGEEFVYVLEGQVKISVGERTYKLDAGESVTFWSSEEHAYAPAEGSPLPARILIVQIGDKA